MGNKAAADLSGRKDTETMTDFLILLLSTDWFLPYWTQIGIDIAEDKKVGIQRGCRHIIDEILNGADSLYLASFSEERKQATGAKFFAVLRQWQVERELAATCNEWRNLSHRELTAVVECAMLNAQVPSADGSGDVPFLEFAIRAEVVNAWETYSLKASVFRDICLNSKTDWDLRTQKMLSSPRTLVNQLWRVLLDHRLRAFWADLRERLTPQQLQDLVAWYRALVKSKSQEDRPDLVPSYMS